MNIAEAIEASFVGKTVRDFRREEDGRIIIEFTDDRVIRFNAFQNVLEYTLAPNLESLSRSDEAWGE